MAIITTTCRGSFVAYILVKIPCDTVPLKEGSSMGRV